MSRIWRWMTMERAHSQKKPRSTSTKFGSSKGARTRASCWKCLLKVRCKTSRGGSSETSESWSQSSEQELGQLGCNGDEGNESKSSFSAVEIDSYLAGQAALMPPVRGKGQKANRQRAARAKGTGHRHRCLFYSHMSHSKEQCQLKRAQG